MAYQIEEDEDFLLALKLQEQLDAEEVDLAYAVQVQDELNHEPLVVQEEPRTSHLPFTQLFDNLRINTNDDNEIEQRKDDEKQVKQFQSETEKLMDKIMRKLAKEKYKKQEQSKKEFHNAVWDMVGRDDTGKMIEFLKNNPEQLNSPVCNTSIKLTKKKKINFIFSW